MYLHSAGVIKLKWSQVTALHTEFLTVGPFYLPREFTVITITAVYISPHANTKEDLSVLSCSIRDLQNTHLEGIFIVAGESNRANIFPLFHQRGFSTRGENTLDLAYTNIKNIQGGTPASPRLLRPSLCDAYSCVQAPVNQRETQHKKVRIWPVGAMEALEDCFKCIDWDTLSFIKNIATRAKEKPWMTKEVCAMLKVQHVACKTGDIILLRTARAKLNHAMRVAKRAHGQKCRTSSRTPQRPSNIARYPDHH